MEREVLVGFYGDVRGAEGIPALEWVQILSFRQHSPNLDPGIQQSGRFVNIAQIQTLESNKVVIKVVVSSTFAKFRFWNLKNWSLCLHSQEETH